MKVLILAWGANWLLMMAGGLMGEPAGASSSPKRKAIIGRF
jgi:hypothetical protein